MNLYMNILVGKSWRDDRVQFLVTLVQFWFLMLHVLAVHLFVLLMISKLKARSKIS